MYLLYRASACSLSESMPIVASMFCIFSFLTLASCRSFKELAVNARVDATTKTIRVANKKV